MFFAASMIGMNFGPVKATLAGSMFTWHIVAETGRFFLNLFSRHGSMEALFGPIGIATVAGQAAQRGLLNVLLLTGVLSISVGIMNLLPLPAFDGGQILMIAAESVRKKRFPPRVYQTVNTVGLTLILAIAAIATYQDILRLIARG
jgi:regulator of sigma E protease